jgi:uncharacterized protein YutE (UPF0331/DUF86 family)
MGTKETRDMEALINEQQRIYPPEEYEAVMEELQAHIKRERIAVETARQRNLLIHKYGEEGQSVALGE